MEKELIDRAIMLMENGRYSDALSLFLKVLEIDRTLWNVWYMAGLCYRFLNKIDESIDYLSQAAGLKKDSPPVLLALGISYQLNSEWEMAIETFVKAIELDKDYHPAYNSLALTQKKCGQLEFASGNYENGLKALARNIVIRMKNRRDNQVLKYKNTIGNYWIEYAMFAAVSISSNEKGIKTVSWLTGEQALEEERYEHHAGLYWIDVLNEKNEMVRLLLPNYFNTFREILKSNPTYSLLLRNRAEVLLHLGEMDEADLHFREAKEFETPNFH